MKDPGPEEPVPPSGRQFQLRHGDQEAVVTEVGATLRDYRLGGRPVLDGFPPSQRSRDGRGQLLLPWPNRIEDGRYAFLGSEHQLPINEVDRQNAIHGLVRWTPWTLREVTDEKVMLSVVVADQPGYEFSLLATVEYRLTEIGLTVTVQATNRGSGPLPFGLGSHPYLLCGTAAVDEVRLQVPAALRYETDARGLPLGDPLPVAGTAFDFSQPRPLGSLALDTTFTGLLPDSSGNTTVELSCSKLGTGVRLWADETHGYLQLFTGDSLPDPTARRRSLAVEPMTCPPNAFRTGQGVVVLDPGRTLTSRWGIQAW